MCVVAFDFVFCVTIQAPYWFIHLAACTSNEDPSHILYTMSVYFFGVSSRQTQCRTNNFIQNGWALSIHWCPYNSDKITTLFSTHSHHIGWWWTVTSHCGNEWEKKMCRRKKRCSKSQVSHQLLFNSDRVFVLFVSYFSLCPYLNFITF